MRGKRSTPAERKSRLVKEACKAHSDLNIFYAVIALMESSLLSSSSFRAEERIAAICRAEGQKCLGRLDRATAALGAIES